MVMTVVVVYENGVLNAEMCQRVTDGFGMPVEWALSIVVPIFKRKGDILKCGSYGAV